MNLSTKPRVVVDTNVILSAILYGGIPKKVIGCVQKNRVIMLLSPEIEKEIVTQFTAFSPSPDAYILLQILLERHSVKILPRKAVHKSRDPKDDMFLTLCFAGHADYLVTGDKDLLVLRKFGSTVILTPRQFLKEV